MVKEEAIEILSDMRAEHNIFSDDEEEATRYHALSWAIQALNEQQRTGRWEMKPDPYGFFDEIPVCSECGCTTKMRETYKYCPNCGARMEVQE